MTAGGTPSAVAIGPGRLWIAVLGTTEPSDGSTALPSAWKAIGYTDTGHAFTTEITTEAVEVAEEIDPIRYVNTKRASSIQFSMAEATRRNLARALNVGAYEVNDGTAFEPPTPGTEVRTMIVWDSADSAGATNARWLFRQCYQSDAIEIAHRKAPEKALIPVRFNLEKPDSLAPYKVWPVTATGLVA